ncbi:MAG: hypothetical protein A2267_05155 [Omnitrophica WOR_2 bacterium RIFOXYA12_FULL_38_10]|nr:MAG: hypothetical protein A2267_05155 [Omnitrophica WOR_2 bacterium RIFOXYA12_FULL_38_10]
MKDKIRNVFNFFVRVGLSVALLYYIFSKIDMEKTKAVLRSAEIIYIFYAFLTFIVINIIILVRWRIYIKALDIDASTLDITRYYLVGLFGNLFLPSAIGGDLIKIYGLCKGSNQKARVVASVLLDRLSGFASIVIVAVTSFVVGYKYIQNAFLLVPIAVMAFCSFGIAAVLFNEKIYSFGCRVFNGFPKIKNNLMKLHYDIMLLNDKRMEGVKAIGLSCLSQVTFAFTFYFTARALHQDISIIYFLIFIPLICVASSVPSIGGLGVREAGTAFLFAKVGVDSGISVSMSLISFLFMVVVGLIGGAVYVITLHSGRLQYSPSDAG